MLNKIRGDVKKKLWVLLILIVPAFVLWGANSFFRRSSSTSTAVIYGRKISPQAISDYTRNIQLLFLFKYGREALNNLKQDSLITLAWQDMILSGKAEKEKIRVSDKELAGYISSFPYLNTNRGFSKEKYLMILQQAHAVPAQFEQFLKEQIEADKLKEKLLSKITLSEEEAKKNYLSKNKQAKIKYILIDIEGLKKKISPSPEEVKSFYNNNLISFKTEPQARIKYLLIKHPSQNLITQIEKKLRSAKDIDKTAEDFGLESVDSGFFTNEGPIKELGWHKDVISEAFGMKMDEFSGAIEIPEGILFMVKTGKKPSRVPDFAEITDKVRKRFIQESAEKKAEETAKKISEEIKQDGIKDLETVVKSFPETKVSESGYFKPADYIDNIGWNLTFNNKIFAHKKGDIILPPVRLKKGFYIAQVSDIKPADEDKFNKEKESYMKNLLAQKRASAMNSYLLGLVKESGFKLFQRQ